MAKERINIDKKNFRRDRAPIYKTKSNRSGVNAYFNERKHIHRNITSKREKDLKESPNLVDYFDAVIQNNYAKLHKLETY